MPFLHYETDEKREKMSAAIKRAQSGRDLPNDPSRDDLLVQAYLNASPPLHTRRTLDQFFYHGIDTAERDRDQVVYRYCKRRGLEPKIFMVDQLWLWVVGKELIITSFPQRWQQPKNDPLNVLDGIIEDMNAKTRPPILSVYDLAMLITSRCLGLFDRHRLDNENYQFLDMFESSIGHVTNRESKLFERFNRASALAARWLKYHRRDRAPRAQRLPSPSPHRQPDLPKESKDKDADPIFVDALLDIGIETSLLAEIKDIRDELNIIAMVLSYQSSILPEFTDHITEELRKDGSRKATDAVVGEIRKRAREQMRVLDVHRKDIERMDKQADGIYTSLAHLLDLKQKHANAFEARFARDQAVIAGRQGQTIMVFTIVTIIFLPMSFIAAFFAINIREFNEPLALGYVSKYMFGIGLSISIPLIAMAFAVDDLFETARGISSYIKRHLLCRREVSEETEDEMHRGRSDTITSIPRPSLSSEKPPRSPIRLDGFSLSPPPPRKSSIVDRNPEYLNSSLSPVSADLVRSRRYSGGRTTALTWARASLDRGRSRISEDLERGRDTSSQRIV
jgi:Mg2+ and Co2+ transporter CorA